MEISNLIYLNNWPKLSGAQMRTNEHTNIQMAERNQSDLICLALDESILLCQYSAWGGVVHETIMRVSHIFQTNNEDYMRKQPKFKLHVQVL